MIRSPKFYASTQDFESGVGNRKPKGRLNFILCKCQGRGVPGVSSIVRAFWSLSYCWFLCFLLLVLPSLS